MFQLVSNFLPFLWIFLTLLILALVSDVFRIEIDNYGEEQNTDSALNQRLEEADCWKIWWKFLLRGNLSLVRILFSVAERSGERKMRGNLSLSSKYFFCTFHCWHRLSQRWLFLSVLFQICPHPHRAFLSLVKVRFSTFTLLRSALPKWDWRIFSKIHFGKIRVGHIHFVKITLW